MAANLSNRKGSPARRRASLFSAAAILAIASGALIVGAGDIGWALGAALVLATLAALLAGLALARRQPAPSPVPKSEAASAAALDTLRKRLDAIEASLTDIARHGGAGVRNDLSELTAEIGLLGGLMKDLAETVASHDERLDSTPQRRDEKDAGPGPDMARAPAVVPADAVVPPHVYAAVSAVPDFSTEQALFEEPDGPGGGGEEPSPAWHTLPASPATPLDRRAVGWGRDDGRDASIAAAIERDRIELCLQPIVSLPQRKAKLYEALARVRLDAAELLSPAEFIPMAERRGLIAALDERVVTRALKIARHLQRSGEASVSCNISPLSMAQAGFLRVLLRLAECDAETIGRLVVELPQRAFRALDAERSGALAALVDKGVRLSMDAVQDLRFDPAMLAAKGVCFIKISAPLLLGDGADVSAEIHPADIPAMLARAGISLIAEKVESEATAVELLDLNVPLAQGFLFGMPRPVRAEIYASGGVASPQVLSSAKPAPQQKPPEPDAAPPSGPRPFRAFLRRAGA